MLRAILSGDRMARWITVLRKDLEMATVLIPAPTGDGCDHCSAVEYRLELDGEWIPGYCKLASADNDGIYEYLGRCFYCNHRDRH